MEITASFTQVAGKAVHYLEAGKQDSTTTIVLLHGASFSSSTWRDTGTIAALTSATIRTFALDLPGYGPSESTVAPSNQWLGLLLESLHIQRPVILAASMSGKFALPFITSRPENVRAFVAVAPVGIPDYSDALSNIEVPVLAIWGENDQIVPLGDAELLVHQVKFGRLVIIPRGSHAPYMSNPTLFNSELINFINDLD